MSKSIEYQYKIDLKFDDFLSVFGCFLEKILEPEDMKNQCNLK